MNAWIIAIKDTRARFRDRSALMLMLLAPLVIASIMSMALGGLVGGKAGGLNARVAVVNEDASPLGAQFVGVLKSPALASLMTVTEVSQLEAARQQMGKKQFAVVIQVPAAFSRAILRTGQDAAVVNVYGDPGSPVSVDMVNAIVGRVVGQFNLLALSRKISSETLMGNREPYSFKVSDFETALAQELAANHGGDGSAKIVTEGTAEKSFNPLAYFMPGMGVFFLMFTMFDGMRSILTEIEHGTLARMLTTTASEAEILLGKVGGIMLTGIVQFSVLVLTSMLVFKLSWGPSLLAVAVLALALIACCCALGALVIAFSRSADQANSTGTGIILISAVLGGSFFPMAHLPGWLNKLSYLSINRWALDGFTDLTIRHRALPDILPEAAFLALLALVFFSVAVKCFKIQGYR
ncbi:MAG: ABC transporter permease [Iodobacter sp.]